LYWQQFEAAGTRVGAAEQLFNRNFLAGGTLAVVDDADLSRSLVERFVFTAEELAHAHKLLKGKRREPLRRALRVLTQAVLLAQEPERRSTKTTGAAAWDLLARSAHLCGEEVGRIIDALPASPSLPEPETGVDEVLTRERVEAVPPAKLLSLILTLREELPTFLAGEDFNSRLRLSAAGLEVWRLREHVQDRHGLPLLPDMDLLVLDATPVAALVDYLTRDHARLPDVEARVRLPENVRVVQYATATNGHAVLREEDKTQAVLAEIAAERLKHPAAPAKEGAVCFRATKKILAEAGFPESQVVPFGSVRGTNSLGDVERLHLVGRPMPPGDELVFLAQVLYFGESPVSEGMVLSRRAYGGQPYEVDVVDFADARVAALLRAEREDEMEQAIHRARIFAVDQPQLRLLSADEPEKRRAVRVVLHTSQPVPGLRVDELILSNPATSVNEKRHDNAEHRIRAAVLRLEEMCEEVTTVKVAKLARASRRTVAEYLRTRDHTPKEDLSYKGVITSPQTKERDLCPAPLPLQVAPPNEAKPEANLCRGSCGKPMPPGQMCFVCATREVQQWVHSMKRRRSA